MNLVLKLSKLCNLRCTYCYEYGQLGDATRMPLDGLGRFFEGLAAYCRALGTPVPIQFVLHGGEPTLLPADYLRSFVELQRRHLGGTGIPYRNALQTNLYRVKDETLELLKELGISMSVSTDVFGRDRVTASGADSEARVKVNLDRRLELGRAQGLLTGGIAVLHAGNADRAVETFEFFAERGLSYRILPIFSMDDPAARMKHLMLAPEQVIEALKKVALARFSRPGTDIAVYPLQEYLIAAIHHLSGRPAAGYDPEQQEWALIIDTNGDAYNHGEAYNPIYRMGNVFHHSFGALLKSEGRLRSLTVRLERKETCRRCVYYKSCSHVPMIEALPSERARDPSGRMRCAVAEPMIRFMADLILAAPTALARLQSAG